MANLVDTPQDVIEVTIHRGSNGLGLNIKGGKDQPQSVNDDGIFISEVKNTAVTTGTIQKGDKVLEINGMSTEGLSHDETIELFKKAGQEVTLNICRGANESLVKPAVGGINKKEELSLLIKKELGLPVTWQPTPEIQLDCFPRPGQLGDAEEVLAERIRQGRERGLQRLREESSDNDSSSSEEGVSNQPSDEIDEDVNESAEEIFRKLAAENRINNRTIDDDNLPPTVSLLHGTEGQKIYLIGTAHFSQESCEDVKTVINEAQPDVVVIELCRGRTDMLVNDEESVLKLAGDITTGKILSQIRHKGLAAGLMTFLLLHMSAHITKQLGMAPGGEFRTAFKEARRVPGCKIMFGDRAVEVTLQRAFGTLSLWEKMKFAFHILKDLGPIKAEDIEKLKEKDVLEQALGEMIEAFPQMAKVFLDERDTYLAHSLQLAGANEIRTEGDTSPIVVVGVVGLGHAGGIKENFGNNITHEDMEGLMKIPKPSMAGRTLKICIRLALLVGVGYSLWTVFGWTKPVFNYLLASGGVNDTKEL